MERSSAGRFGQSCNAFRERGGRPGRGWAGASCCAALAHVAGLRSSFRGDLLIGEEFRKVSAPRAASVQTPESLGRTEDGNLAAAGMDGTPSCGAVGSVLLLLY